MTEILHPSFIHKQLMDCWYFHCCGMELAGLETRPGVLSYNLNRIFSRHCKAMLPEKLDRIATQARE